MYIRNEHTAGIVISDTSVTNQVQKTGTGVLGHPVCL